MATTDYGGRTLLHAAANAKNILSVAYLLEYAPRLLVDGIGETALAHAVQSGERDIVRLIEEAAAGGRAVPSDLQLPAHVGPRIEPVEEEAKGGEPPARASATLLRGPRQALLTCLVCSDEIYNHMSSAKHWIKGAALDAFRRGRRIEAVSQYLRGLHEPMRRRVLEASLPSTLRDVGIKVEDLRV